MAIRALGLSGNMGNGGQPGGVVQPGHRGQPGEIIISSFTWIATVSAIKWEGCVPVCCDINPKTLNLDPAEIERHITERTVAIMPVHVFGNPCDVEAIEAVARKHNLKVIYDAAHAIGSTWKGESVLSWGDVSGTSLHATKLLNTGEGGGCITRDPGLWEKLERIRFFGHDAQKDIVEDGFNGKMTEVHAALGLANLRYYREVLADRKRKYALYLEMLDGVPGLEFQQMQPGGESNYSYFAVMFESEEVLLRVIEALAAVHVFPRRYFYPSVNRFTKVLAYRSTPVAENISSRILCLPHYLGLKEEEMSAICDVIRREVVRNL
jgi:dTDP-4-amino-4,6-dideoxygalactose transaminase